ncbi:MAG TPA: lysine 2,3-aminomutase, partial [Candidatus Aminicenantes bacterium]|nr:lysine 2,3-aminomutase [Candidatus Aminicenantes bacterium]
MLISGGDPFLLGTKRLDEILTKVRRIPHLDLFRIGTRVPCVWPQKITEDAEFVEMLASHTPKSLKDPQFFINTHFNHPAEITEQSYRGVQVLRKIGIPL